MEASLYMISSPTLLYMNFAYCFASLIIESTIDNYNEFHHAITLIQVHHSYVDKQCMKNGHGDSILFVQ